MAGLRLTALFAISLFAQDPTSSDLDHLRQELQDTIQAGNLAKASEIAVKLDDGVQRQFRESLERDASQRVDQVLDWLPTGTDTLFVLQYPIVLHAQGSREITGEGPARQYAFDRLMALNHGDIYRRLEGKTVRLTAVGIRSNHHPRASGVSIIPATMPDADATYLYFFTEPVVEDILGEPDTSSNLGPMWRGTAEVDAGEPWTPGRRERAQREDSNWLAFPRPDLLVLCSRRETLAEVLQHIAGGTANKPDRPDRALPERLSIWQQVDRKAKFWALRRYSDSVAGGLSVRFDVDSGELDIRYLGGAATPPDLDSTMSQQFKATHMQNDVWQFESSTRERGDFPFHAAAAMLGFGVYR
ncbi:MAG TPA: hypothetical protein VHZ07_24040 [Bryobacteraceae bacterium]|jgi:hypothetical protein|nr:hypothetical protein [Bryobacteraceae bacterium]